MIVKFIIETDNLRDPKLALKLIKEHIMLICGECSLEAPEGYLNGGEDLR